ncbi:MAG: family 1 glycosylhydrolase [Pyrobaculum sp.]
MLTGAAVSPYQHFGFCKCDLPDEAGALHLFHYREDIDLAKGLGLEAFRTGIEWALVEPREKSYDKEAVRLFFEYLKYIKERGLKTWVTLHHFTNPRWVWRYGGWESRYVAKRFLEYVDLVGRELGDVIDVALIFNEPNMYTFLAYIKGDLPPYGFLSIKHMQKVEKNIIEVILEARDLLKSYNITTSYTYSYTKFETHHIFFKPVISILNNINRKFLKLFKNMDYTSINFYVVSKFVKFTFRYVLKPEALLELKAWTPLAVTEFGVSTRDEEFRYRYLCAMSNVFKKLEPVAVFWWSFLHGYEWGLGYTPFFALVDVKGGERIVTPLAEVYVKTLKNPPMCEIGEVDLGLEWRLSYRNFSSDDSPP